MQMLTSASSLSLSALQPTAGLTLQMEEIYLKDSNSVRLTTVQKFAVIPISYTRCSFSVWFMITRFHYLFNWLQEESARMKKCVYFLWDLCHIPGIFNTFFFKVYNIETSGHEGRRKPRDGKWNVAKSHWALVVAADGSSLNFFGARGWHAINQLSGSSAKYTHMSAWQCIKLATCKM